MNRYKAGGPSKASSTTQCQKCLQRGHYSYECTSKQQERPYNHRPSRTQQLANPKLAPKITEATPPKTEAQKKSEQERNGSASLKRKLDGGPESSRKRSRSVSSYSSDSDSVCTVSTNASRSRSRSPPSRRRSPSPRRRELKRERSPPPRRQRSLSRSSSLEPDRRHRQRHSRERDRPKRMNSRSRSPARKPHRRSSSRTSSPYRERRDGGYREAPSSTRAAAPAPPPRQRSLSPYSKRLALTRGN